MGLLLWVLGKNPPNEISPFFFEGVHGLILPGNVIFAKPFSWGVSQCSNGILVFASLRLGFFVAGTEDLVKKRWVPGGVGREGGRWRLVNGPERFRGEGGVDVLGRQKGFGLVVEVVGWI